MTVHVYSFYLSSHQRGGGLQKQVSSLGQAFGLAAKMPVFYTGGPGFNPQLWLLTLPSC